MLLPVSLSAALSPSPGNRPEKNQNTTLTGATPTHTSNPFFKNLLLNHSLCVVQTKQKKRRQRQEKKNCIRNYTGESFSKIPICVLKAWLNNLGLHRKTSRKENSSDLYNCPAPRAYQAFYLVSLHKNLIL